MHLRLACRMNVKNETARILRAHAERAVSANAFVKIYFNLYRFVLSYKNMSVDYQIIPSIEAYFLVKRNQK